VLESRLHHGSSFRGSVPSPENRHRRANLSNVYVATLCEKGRCLSSNWRVS
jgi:hypothetical protein